MEQKTLRLRVVGCLPVDGGGFRIDRVIKNDINFTSTKETFQNIGTTAREFVSFLLFNANVPDYQEKIKRPGIVLLFDDSGDEIEDSMTFEHVVNNMLVVVFINDRDWPPYVASEVIKNSNVLKKIFIGHGRSTVWREIKDFLQDRLELPWDEFNREPTAGIATKERLQKILDESNFALLIMTAEDEHANNTLHARENVIHEAGLFQGKLGFRKAIILLEEGCTEFSNIAGLGQIRFQKGNISATFEEIRRVLEREGIT